MFPTLPLLACVVSALNLCLSDWPLEWRPPGLQPTRRFEVEHVCPVPSLRPYGGPGPL